MKRLVLTLMVAVATLLGMSALAPSGTADAQYPPARPPVISINVPSVGPGGNFTVTVGNCEAGERVVITFRGEAKIVICDPTTLQSSAAFAAPMTPGTFEVCADLTGGGATLPAGVTRPQNVCTSVLVAGAAVTVPATIPGGGLPATGSSGLGTTTTSAIVLLGAGAMLLIVSQVRRRRTTHVTA